MSFCVGFTVTVDYTRSGEKAKILNLTYSVIRNLHMSLAFSSRTLWPPKYKCFLVFGRGRSCNIKRKPAVTSVSGKHIKVKCGLEYTKQRVVNN